MEGELPLAVQSVRGDFVLSYDPVSVPGIISSRVKLTFGLLHAASASFLASILDKNL